MKNIKIIIALVTLLVLTWCFSKGNSNGSTNSWTTAVVNKKQKEVLVNTVYNKIADKKVWLKNATNEDLDKILQEEIRLSNTATSKFPFFEQASNKKADIQEIKNAWWMEVTRWNIYLQWLSKDYLFLNDVLSDNEKLYSFNQDSNNFFYLDSDAKQFLEKIKGKYTEFKQISKTKENLTIEFNDNWNKYLLQVQLANWVTRDDMDNILQTNTKSKVIINLSK